MVRASPAGTAPPRPVHRPSAPSKRTPNLWPLWVIAPLSERERDAAVPVCQGKSNAEMARELFVSRPTVKAHVSHIFVKLQVVKRVQIATSVKASYA